LRLTPKLGERGRFVKVLKVLKDVSPVKTGLPFNQRVIAVEQN